MSSVPRTAAQALTLTTIFVAAALGRAEVADQSRHWQSIPLDIADDRPDWQVSEQLDVNLAITHRLVVPDLCESDGERELVGLSASVATEEAFIFVPPLCLWIEAGSAESEKSVHVDGSLIRRLLRRYPDLVLYHIHPGTTADAVDYFPAYSDLLGVILINGPYLDKPEVSVRHRAVSAMGVIDYEFRVTEDTARLVEKMNDTGLAKTVAQNLAYTYASQEHQASYYGALQNCSVKISGRANRMAECFPITSRGFVLYFRSAEMVMEKK